MTALADLLDALAAAPNLPQARCVDRRDLFDAAIEADRTGPGGAADLAQAREAALSVCAACPELEPCRAWFDALPPKRRPLGVCGGRLNTGRSPKQPKQERVA